MYNLNTDTAFLHRDTLNKIAALICHLYPPPIHPPHLFAIVIYCLFIYCYCCSALLIFFCYICTISQRADAQTTDPRTAESERKTFGDGFFVVVGIVILRRCKFLFMCLCFFLARREGYRSFRFACFRL